MRFISVLFLLLSQLGCASRSIFEAPSGWAKDRVNFELSKLKSEIREDDLVQFQMMRLDIRKILKEQKVIEEVEALPFVESLYRNRKGTNNAGIWNFERHTALLYRLEVNPNVDERNDVIKSTRAVSRYLRVLYELLGDWPLAIIAYHHGASQVMEMKRANIKLTPWEAEMSLNPNNLYWSQFLAAVQMVEQAH